MSEPEDGIQKERSRSVHRLLEERAEGETKKAEELLPLVYEELRALARARMREERPGQTIQATVLVHEAYLRLVGSRDPGWNGRRHFFGAAALAMRRILLEQARKKGRIKHGGGKKRVDLGEVEIPCPGPSSDILALEEAVRRLERLDSRKGDIVNLRYYGGFTSEETASALGVSLGTVEREWRFIKVWLQEQLGEDDDASSS